MTTPTQQETVEPCAFCGIRYGYHLASCAALTDRASVQGDMRAEFMAWVQDCGCDTDGAWSAWQAAWNRRATSLSQQKGEPDKLHAAIMNLPCKSPYPTGTGGDNCYRVGHRDARHAAAELVAGYTHPAPAKGERLQALEWAAHELLQRCEDSEDAKYGTLSTSFVRGILSAALSAAPKEGDK